MKSGREALGVIGVCVALGLLILLAAAWAGVMDTPPPCTHGESSVVAERGPDGAVQVSEPHVTGCVK